MGQANEMEKSALLVVEDDPDIRESLKLTFEFEGFDVHTAENGKEAMDLLLGGTSPRVILLDLMMPVMNGFEFLELRAKIPEIARIPVLVVSAFPEQAKKVTANGFLCKPLKIDALLSEIRRLGG